MDPRPRVPPRRRCRRHDSPRPPLQYHPPAHATIVTTGVTRLPADARRTAHGTLTKLPTTPLAATRARAPGTGDLPIVENNKHLKLCQVLCCVAYLHVLSVCCQLAIPVPVRQVSACLPGCTAAQAAMRLVGQATPPRDLPPIPIHPNPRPCVHPQQCWRPLLCRVSHFELPALPQQSVPVMRDTKAGAGRQSDRQHFMLPTPHQCTYTHVCTPPATLVPFCDN